MTTHDNADYGKPASLLTAGEVAEILRVSEPTIRNLRRRGELRYARIGGKVLFRGVDVDAYIVSNLKGGRNERRDPGMVERLREAVSE
jgi:excisionase family DNA binding protein